MAYRGKPHTAKKIFLVKSIEVLEISLPLDSPGFSPFTWNILTFAFAFAKLALIIKTDKFKIFEGPYSNIRLVFFASLKANLDVENGSNTESNFSQFNLVNSGEKI